MHTSDVFLSALPGTTPIHQLIHAHDWTPSPLGAPAGWPSSLKSVLAMMLESTIPMSIVWGPERVLLYNQSYVLFLGEKHPADAFGLPIREVWPEIWSDIGPLIERAAGGEAFYLEDVPLPIQRNGALEDAWFTFSYSPVRDDAGQLAGMCSAVMETTSRVLGEQRQALLVRLARALGPLSLPAAIVDAAAAQIAPYLKLDRVMYARAAPGDAALPWHDAWVRPDGDADQAGGPSDLEVDRIVRGRLPALTSGQPLVVHTQAAAAGDEVGDETMIGDLVIIALPRPDKPLTLVLIRQRAARRWKRDETALLQEAAAYAMNAAERARAEQDLRQLTMTLEQRVGERTAALENALQALRDADRHKDQFLAMLAHELRNPLAPIRTASAILKLPGLPAARTRATGDIIERQVQHMTGMVDDLLDVSRVTRGLVSLDRRRIDIHTVIDDAIEQAVPLMEARGHCLQIVRAGEACIVDGDVKRLVQVFVNLLNNAAKYTPDGGTIAVRIRGLGDTVDVEISDNGVGIAADILPYVFDLFVQGVRMSDRAQGGLGIGLALVRSLVNSHGGTVLARSAGANAGSAFTVALPRISEPGAAGAPALAPAPILASTPGSGNSERRLLVVDDNADAADTLGLLLQHSGYTVEVEYDPRQALEKAAATRFDVFVLDIGMPHMDGYELARRLRLQGLAAGSVLIALTGYGDAQARASGREAGFDHYLTKPADLDQLLALLRDAASRRR